MEISVNAVKFKAAESLLEFIDKKVGKVETLLPQAIKADVTLKVDKDQSEMNKIAEVRVAVSGDELFASKQCDTFAASFMLRPAMIFSPRDMSSDG